MCYHLSNGLCYPRFFREERVHSLCKYWDEFAIGISSLGPTGGTEEKVGESFGWVTCWHPIFQIACLFDEKPFWGFQLALSLGIQKNHPTFSSLFFLPANSLYCLRLKTCDDDALEDMVNRCSEQAHRWFCGLSNIQWNLVGLIDVSKSDDRKAQKFLKLGIRPIHRSIPFNSHPIRSRWTAASWFAHRPKRLPMSSTRRAPDTWVGGLAFGFDLNSWIKSNFEIWVYASDPARYHHVGNNPKANSNYIEPFFHEVNHQGHQDTQRLFYQKLCQLVAGWDAGLFALLTVAPLLFSQQRQSWDLANIGIGCERTIWSEVKTKCL